jgi:hypothetical protein
MQDKSKTEEDDSNEKRNPCDDLDEGIEFLP